jgi:hypothetical protein
MAKRKIAGGRTSNRAAPVPNRSSSGGSRYGNGPIASGTFSVRVPLAFSKRGGRKIVITPHGSSAWAPQQTRVDNSLVKAIARSHRWKQMMESGTYASITELAVAEKVNLSYLCKVLRLTLLAPNIIEAVLDGSQGAGLQLYELMKPFPVDWKIQTKYLDVKSDLSGSVQTQTD